MSLIHQTLAYGFCIVFLTVSTVGYLYTTLPTGTDHFIVYLGLVLSGWFLGLLMGIGENK